jgi:hypothetical protein
MKIVTSRPLIFPLSSDRRNSTTLSISTLLPGYPSKVAPEFESDFIIAPRRFPLSPTRRLVVLIPEGSLDENLLARKTWQLASPAALQVLLLGISPDGERASTMRRRLALLSANLVQAKVSASTSIVVGGNWNQALRKVIRKGDVLVCIARHKIAYYNILPRALGETLASAFEVPVYMLGGLKVGWSPVYLQRVRSMAAWGVSMFTLVAFAWLQIWISQNASKQLSSILICVSIVAEAITLLKANEWIG